MKEDRLGNIIDQHLIDHYKGQVDEIKELLTTPAISYIEISGRTREIILLILGFNPQEMQVFERVWIAPPHFGVPYNVIRVKIQIKDFKKEYAFMYFMKNWHKIEEKEL